MGSVEPAKTLKQAQDERIQGATGERMAAEKAKTLDQFKAYGGKISGERVEPPPTKPAPAGDRKIEQGVGGTKRKHDWAQVGVTVRHKDSSTGTIRVYEPATQTAHVEWEKGPRSQKGGVRTVLGRMGTTKAYHIAPKDVAPKLTGRERALHGTKFPDSAPKPKVEIKRPADPFAGIPNAYAEPSHSVAMRGKGLEPITGKETHGQLIDKLTDHYRAVQAGTAGRATVEAHHTAMGVPKVIAHQDLQASRKAEVAAHVAKIHRRAPEGTQMPLVTIEDTSGMKGSNDLATSVAAYYNLAQHKIGVGQKEVNAKYDPPGRYHERGFFSRSGHATFLERSITHEYGHSLAMNLSQVQQSKMLTEVAHALPGATPPQPGMGTQHWIKANRAVIINKVGTYASADERELAAELYTEFVHTAAPSPAAQVVGKYLEGKA